MGQDDIFSYKISQDYPKMEIVECHSGFTYAERPVSLIWNNQRLEVDSILATWLAPGERHFKVRTRDQAIFELIYQDEKDEWQIKPIQEK